MFVIWLNWPFKASMCRLQKIPPGDMKEWVENNTWTAPTFTWIMFLILIRHQNNLKAYIQILDIVTLRKVLLQLKWVTQTYPWDPAHVVNLVQNHSDVRRCVSWWQTKTELTGAHEEAGECCCPFVLLPFSDWNTEFLNKLLLTVITRGASKGPNGI